MFCPKCGAQNDDDARFCSKCGNDLLSANKGDATTGGSNQNQDVTFNGAGLKCISVVGKDGITRDFPVKWLPEEFDRMNPAQLVQALTEIFAVIDELTGLVDNQVNLESECKQLEADNMMPMDTTKLAAHGIILLAIVILSIAVVAVGGLSVAALSVIGILLFFVLIGLLFSFLGCLISEVSSRSKRKKAYKNRYGAACKELDEAKRRVNDYADQNAVIIRTAHAVLPDYYYDEYALAHMITSLKNHRATSLGEALNLFITDKNAKEQHQLVQKQLRAAELAAENAGRAADAAASAASAADRAATNTYYNNLRNP